MSHKKSRRHFLADMTKSLGLLGISPSLATMIVQSLARSANAANVDEKIYVHFSLAGGPPRWLFDLPLSPNGMADVAGNLNSGLGTYVGMSTTGAQVTYRPWQDPRSKLWLPPVWGSHPAGGAFTNTLANAAFVRGVDHEINDHNLGRLRNQSPIVGGISIAGALAEKNSTPFPAATSGSIGAAFKGYKGTSPVTLNLAVNANTNPIKTAVNYFGGARAPNSLASKNAQDKFNQYASEQGFQQPTLVAAKANADTLIKAGIEKFNTRWTSTYQRYQDKVSAAMTRNNTGVFCENRVIPLPSQANGQPDPRIRIDNIANTFLGTMNDLRNMIDNQTTVQNLAATYAAIEILVLENLSNVITVDISQMMNLKSNDTGNSRFMLSNDQHRIGSLVATLATSYYYRAILSCTEELVIALKADRLFDRTLLHFGSEFNRNARNDGSGSDHGFLGCSALLISGMIESTLVIGNIKPDTSVTYRGHWGLAANHPVTKNKPIRLNDVVKTVCAMLGLPNVSANGEDILFKIGGRWKKAPGRNGEARNV